MIVDPVAVWISNLTSEEMAGLPFVIGRKELDHRFIDATNSLQRLKGVKSNDEIHGFTACELPCPSAEFAANFETADKTCINQKKKISQIGMYTFPNNQFGVHLIERYPMYDHDKNIIGTSFISTDITMRPIVRFAKWLQDNDKAAIGNRVSKAGRPLAILDNNVFLNLSQRETEVLFYLVRGYSYNQIATILGIKKYTAITYTNNIKEKLLCQSKQQVFEKVIELDFLNMIPASLLQQGTKAFPQFSDNTMF